MKNMNYKLETSPGDNFYRVSDIAKRIASEKNVVVEFEFNGVTCLVDEDTNMDFLYRDYANSWTMEWKVVGPNCLNTYEPEVQAELEKRNKDREEKMEIENAAHRDKELKERNEFAAKGLYKEEFKEKLKWYTETIQWVEKEKGLDTLSAVLLICKDSAVTNNGMATMLFLAAAVEIIEPTN